MTSHTWYWNTEKHSWNCKTVYKQNERTYEIQHYAQFSALQTTQLHLRCPISDKLPEEQWKLHSSLSSQLPSGAAALLPRYPQPCTSACSQQTSVLGVVELFLHAEGLWSRRWCLLSHPKSMTALPRVQNIPQPEREMTHSKAAQHTRTGTPTGCPTASQQLSHPANWS